MTFGTSLIIPSPTPLSLHSPSLFALKPTSLRRKLFSRRAAEAAPPLDPQTASSEVVRSFYSGINCHDLSSVRDLIAHNCVYEDLVFPDPFVGRTAILEFFQKFTDSTSTDLQFVIDDISTEESSAVGVTWHLVNWAEWKGRNFPFSKGCSFYRLEVIDGKRQIVYGRDCVEPAIKPGEAVLAAIRAVTWLLQRFPRLVDRL
ncbi:PREDICTED: uncharacterized protein LOC104810399 isoform X2 [Tarenaya hassleriana]|uniref:uncharacterized protein LOC104810399 isoform X2 n=1 Tax=Tarenaya hassleriana TaxID=28532 RepID=UPI00053CA910|nr:PREDICTED: uncharacterized protein LOC104810399 isoform X2 [Tarenaya hassleriana]